MIITVCYNVTLIAEPFQFFPVFMCCKETFSCRCMVKSIYFPFIRLQKNRFHHFRIKHFRSNLLCKLFFGKSFIRDLQFFCTFNQIFFIIGIQIIFYFRISCKGNFRLLCLGFQIHLCDFLCDHICKSKYTILFIKKCIDFL